MGSCVNRQRVGTLPASYLKLLDSLRSRPLAGEFERRRSGPYPMSNFLQRARYIANICSGSRGAD